MFSLKPTAHFERKLAKLLRRRPELKDTLATVFANLETDPNTPSLRSHKVTARDGTKAVSSRVTGDLRIIWRHVGENVLELSDIGGHSGGSKVYR